jgi:hypothetical protein
MNNCIITKEYIEDLHEWIELVLKEAGYKPYAFFPIQKNCLRNEINGDIIELIEIQDFISFTIMEPIIQGFKNSMAARY